MTKTIHQTKDKTVRRIVLMLTIFILSLIVVDIVIAAPSDSIINRISKVVFDMTASSNTLPTRLAEATPSSEQNLPPRQNWNIYEDTIVGFAFPYPDDWQIAEVIPGKSIRLVNTSPSTDYRAIEFLIYDNTDSFTAESFLNKQLAEVYHNRPPAALVRESPVLPNIQGVRIKNFSPGIHTTVVFTNEDRIFWISLIEGGEIGGGSASNSSTAPNDIAIFNTILAGLEFSPK